MAKRCIDDSSMFFNDSARLWRLTESIVFENIFFFSFILLHKQSPFSFLPKKKKKQKNEDLIAGRYSCILRRSCGGYKTHQCFHLFSGDSNLKKNWRSFKLCSLFCLCFQLLAALTVSLCSMVLGFTAGYTSPALITMTDKSVTSFEVSPQAVSV